MMKLSKNLLLYFLSPLLSLTIFCVIFQIWAIDLNLPIFDYSRDSLMSFFEAKTVIDSGWFFSNNLVGLPGNFVLHDFPMHADSLNFALLKVFSYFSSNPFLIVNCFFISSFVLVSLCSFAALRALNISLNTSLLISIIYTFIPYHFVRGTHHLFLSNYAIVPLILLLAIWMLNGEIETFVLNKKNHQKNSITFSFTKKFFIALLITVFAAASGIYYSFFAIIIFTFVWILNGMRSGNFFEIKNFAAPIFIAVIVTILFYLNLPSMVYWTQEGFNSFVTSRAPQESATFALKIINLFLPTANHYLDYFTNLRGSFDEFAYEEESGAESLGIMGCTGFLFLIMWLISKDQKNENSFFQKTLTQFSLNEKEQNLISDLAILNIFLVLFFTASGLVMFIALPFPFTRSYARISIFIGFIALLLLAIIIDKVFQKKLLTSKNPAATCASVVLIFSVFSLVIFDQVGKVDISPKFENTLSIQSDALKRKFFSDQKFITQIEENLPVGSAVFILPCEGFPEYRGSQDYELLIPYLHSKNLRWSYPAITGRSSYLWQEKVSNMKFSDFLSEVRKENFSGILIDRSHYASDRSWKELRKMEMELKMKSKTPAIISPNNNLVFFQI